MFHSRHAKRGCGGETGGSTGVAVIMVFDREPGSMNARSKSRA